MNRRAAIQMALGSACLGSFTGCLTDLRFWDAKPAEPKVTPASIEVARRVDELVKRIVDQNTFTGIEPIVRVLGVPESVLFHRGNSEVFISEGLVKKCKTEPELAAVLCSELGKMMAQKRAGITVGRDRDSIPDIALPGGSSDTSRVREAEMALQQKRIDEKREQDESEASQLSKQLLKGAGFNPAEFDSVQGMVRQSSRGDAIKKQMAGTAAAPTWNR